MYFMVPKERATWLSFRILLSLGVQYQWPFKNRDVWEHLNLFLVFFQFCKMCRIPSKCRPLFPLPSLQYEQRQWVTDSADHSKLASKPSSDPHVTLLILRTGDLKQNINCFETLVYWLNLMGYGLFAHKINNTSVVLVKSRWNSHNYLTLFWEVQP